MKKISIVGCGFVGLCLAVVAAKKKSSVIAVDTDLNKIQSINSGKAPFFEPEISEYLEKALHKNLIVTNDISDAVVNSDITFVTVGTPPNPDGTANLDFIKSAIEDIGKSLKNKNTFHLVVIKSTILPTITNKILKPILENASGKNNSSVGLVMNPEFLREGSAITDTEQPHLIVIGSDTEKARSTLRTYYEDLYDNFNPEFIETSIETAELIKYANNAFLATKISFINSIANICQKIPGTNVKDISNAIGKDPRIGNLFLNAGPGYGGSCFPKDVNAFIDFSHQLGYEPVLFQATKEVNDLQVNKVLELIKSKLKTFENKTISIFGLSFKKDTDDIRESVSVKLINELLKCNVNIRAHDPMAIEISKKLFGKKINFSNTINGCLNDSDCCVIMTDWNDYKNLKESEFLVMRNKLIIDTRRLLINSNFKDVELFSLGVNNESN